VNRTYIAARIATTNVKMPATEEVIESGESVCEDIAQFCSNFSLSFVQMVLKR